MTDEKGNFSFRGLISGNYSIVIDKEKEYEVFSQDFDIIQLRGSPPQTYTINVRLKAKSPDTSKPGVVNAAFANVPSTALEFYKKAVELSEARDHRGAVEQLKLSVEEYPGFMLGYNEMGVQYLRLNELQNAEEAFRKALEIEPEAFEPLMNHGIVLFRMQQFADAEPVLRKALKINQQSAVGHYFLGQSLANLGNFDEGEKELVLSLELGGSEMNEAHRILAIIYSARGEKARAAAQLETYLKVAPNAPDAKQLRDVMLRLKGSDVPPNPPL